MKQNKSLMSDAFTIVFGMLLVSAAVYYIMMPAKLILGGISGLLVVVRNYVNIPLSVLTLAVNIVLLLLGYLVIGREFGTKTVVATMVQPVCLWLFEQITPDPEPLTGDLLVDLICYMLVVGYSQAILFRINASSGGLDIIAKILNKFLGWKIGESITYSGLLIAATSLLVYERKIAVISIVGTYIYGFILDWFFDGFRIRKRVCILSESYKEIQDYIVLNMGRGATLYQAYGGMSQAPRTEIQTILEKAEYTRLLEYISKADPNAFVTVSTVNEVVGKWDTKRKIPFKNHDRK